MVAKTGSGAESILVVVVEARDADGSDLAHLAPSWEKAVKWMRRHRDYVKGSGTWWWVAWQEVLGADELAIHKLCYFTNKGVPMPEQPVVPSHEESIRSAVKTGLDLYFKARRKAKPGARGT